LNIQAYLERIKHNGLIEPSRKTLFDLHQSHLLTVPFENLSIHWDEKISLKPDDLYDKIVRRARGGFCYELNGLFAILLEEIGFEVKRLSAGVANRDGSFKPDFDHLSLLVSIKHEKWLVDVGFGDNFVLPIRLEHALIQDDERNQYRIIVGDPYHVLWSRKPDLDWFPSYRFRLNDYRLMDFKDGCYFHQTSPQSPFTKKRICSKATPKGRISLSELRLIETNGNERLEHNLRDEVEFRQILNSRFGITAPNKDSTNNL
jgi:N-hydroxyarylamine O-acetyltransferase